MRTRNSFSGLLSNEHHRLEALWTDARSTLENGAPVERTAPVEALGKELRRHIRDEEEVLFPAFEERTGMKTGGPTTVMRMEHRQMEALVRDMITTLGRGGDSAQVVERANAFSSLMESHDKKEEGMLYPMMDRAFGEEEGSALLARTSLGRRDP